MPDKVSCEQHLFDYSRYRGKRLYLPLQQRLLLAENEFAFASL